MLDRLRRKIRPGKQRSRSSDELSDEEFLEEVYRRILGREPDLGGKEHYLGHLRQGLSRLDVILDVIRSEEFVNKVIRENMTLPSIRDERPDRYSKTADVFSGQEVWIFRAESMEDFDWLEQRIVHYGYYEKPGVWSLQVTEDKRLLAEIAAVFRPRAVLDVGCANGPVMKCLKDLGIDSDGVDISRLALGRAFPEIKRNIHLGDILDIELPRRYDVILGLDIFEHLNPNRLDDYIRRMCDLLADGGYLYGNIPAFGSDSLFGEIFKVYLREWEEDIRMKRCFRTVHVDDGGYPVNGHLIGGDSEWWVGRFEKAGLRRETEIERALHAKYDAAMDRIHVARKAYYVFSKKADKEKNRAILSSLTITPG